ncbi:hypothetical protein LBMAG27_12830 [Bacteroidota bacterium]|nr:hypothetical protein LBMAG27_12830 [Bacteroidota bacterium]
MILFGVGWFLLFILPFFFVPEKVTDGLFEHRLYIPLIGIFFIVRECIPSIIHFFPSVKKTAFGGLLILFSLMTFTYIQYFNDQTTFYNKIIQDSPNSAKSYFCQAFFAFQKNDLKEIIKYLKKYIELSPEDQLANNNLLSAYYDSRDKQNALKQIEYMKSKKIHINPTVLNCINSF